MDVGFEHDLTTKNPGFSIKSDSLPSRTIKNGGLTINNGALIERYARSLCSFPAHVRCFKNMTGVKNHQDNFTTPLNTNSKTMCVNDSDDY